MVAPTRGERGREDALLPDWSIFFRLWLQKPAFSPRRSGAIATPPMKEP